MENSFKPILFKRKSIKIIDIIHRPFEFNGKIKYFKLEKYFINHVFGQDYNTQKAVEKIKRYILIELFETRRSRNLWFRKFIEKLGIRPGTSALMKLNGEMSIFEYYLYDLLINIMSKYFSITMYQKIRINVIKSLKRFRTLSSLTYLISQEISKAESVIKYLGIEDTKMLVDADNVQLRKLENLKDSEYAFLFLLTSRFLKLNPEYDECTYDPEKMVRSVASVLNSTIDTMIKY